MLYYGHLFPLWRLNRKAVRWIALWLLVLNVAAACSSCGRHIPVIGSLNLSPAFANAVNGFKQALNQYRHSDVQCVYNGPVGDISKLPAGVKRLSVYDLVASGVMITDLSHSGYNMSGVMHGVSEGKRLEWFTRFVPRLKSVDVPYNPQDGSSVLGLGQLQLAAWQLHINLRIRQCDSQDEITKAILACPIPSFFRDNLPAQQNNGVCC